MFDFLNIASKINEVKARMAAIKAELPGMSTTAEGGGGLVKVTVTGDLRVADVVIAQELQDPSRHEELQDLLVLTLNNAIETMRAQVAAYTKQQTEGLLPNIPGMDLGNMLNL